MKIHTVAHLPDNLAIAKAWVAHVRKFDAAHPECHMRISVDAPQATVDEVERMLDTVEPPMPRATVKR